MAEPKHKTAILTPAAKMTIGMFCRYSLHRWGATERRHLAAAVERSVLYKPGRVYSADLVLQELDLPGDLHKQARARLQGAFNNLERRGVVVKHPQQNTYTYKEP